MRHLDPRRTAAVLVVTALCAPGVAALPAAATSQPWSSPAARAADPAPAPSLDWAACEGLPSFDCATMEVPLDYDRPRGDRISLALIRRPADDPSARIGSLLVNPGGPGGSGVGFVAGLGDFLFTPEVRASFDLVGFDPRGIAGSTQLQCFETTEDQVAVLAPMAFPVTRAEEERWVAGHRAVSKACEKRGGPIIDHMSTANVARDMDQIRIALGEERLSFVGYSYGSMIGSTYANMFPAKVRAVVIDGVIDPISWTTGRGDQAETVPVDGRLVSEQGAFETLRQFLDLCDAGGPTCAFSDGDPRKRFDELAAQLLEDPAELPDGAGGTFPFTYADLVAITLGAMYSSEVWGDFAAFLADLEAEVDPAGAAAALQRLGRTTGRAEPYWQVYEGFAGVTCSDSDNPDDESAWARAARRADEKWPYFGRIWNWGSSICASWPGVDTDRWTGPWDRRTAAPVLVVGSRYDPATRYQDAVSTADILGRARLLTVRSWGHTSLFTSSCADHATADYLLTGELPAPGTVCEADAVPFAMGSANRSRDAAKALVDHGLRPVPVGPPGR